jgi:hypothetical protein
MNALRYYSVSCGLEYIEIPKCASTSIKIALAASDGVNVQEYPHASRHWRACPGSFVPCCVFTVVRSPISRIVSAWREKIQTGKAKRLGKPCPLPTTASFEEFARWILWQHPSALDKHWTPQYRILDSAYPCNRILRLERLNLDWIQLMEEFGVPPLPKMNPSPIAEPVFIAPELKQAINNYYQEDCVRFHYL